ncbi:MAG: protein TolQ [Deltaproteobacteria bacterium]|jgi:biopolymer transport protein TolQ|nr:protein TolQ [Deltaproteobacteria bacterium]
MSASLILLEAGQAAAAPIVQASLTGGVEGSIISMVLNAGPVVKLVMGLLVLASFVSWAIILIKLVQLSRAQNHSAKFLDSFWKSRSLANLFADLGNYSGSPIAQIFRVGYQELGRVHKARLDTRTAMGNVERALRRAASAESSRLYKSLSFLATCGNTTPFVGLFGTVWGIMGSFHEIGVKGSANLAAVAPGISEALIATAAGLLCAIPAVIFYNYFNSRIRILETDMGNFMADFVNILERDLLKKPAVQNKEEY